MFKKDFTTHMSANKKTVEKRFKAISSDKKRGIITGISVISAAAVVCGAVWINSTAADKTNIYGKDETVYTTQPQDTSSETEIVNEYNSQYIDVSGKTIAEVAADAGQSLEDFLAEYGLPTDMPADTSESAAYYMISTFKMAQMYGMDFETLKSTMQWDDSITRETPWGIAEGETALSVYIGDQNLEEFKEYYGLDDSITADTKYKEVRAAIDTKNRENRIAAETENPTE